MAVQKTFMDFVEQTTGRLEVAAIEQPTEIPPQFKPKHDMSLANEVTANITRVWDSVRHNADFGRFLDIILAALERREADYMALIKGIDKKELDAYVKIYSMLNVYFLDGNYGDPLGTFYEQNFSYGRNGEFYTPWHVAYFMAAMLDPKPEETIIDPSCGSGIMLLAARCVIHEKYGWFASSRYGRMMYGVDINSRAVKMAKINMYLTDYVFMICLMHDVVMEFEQKSGGIKDEPNCESNKGRSEEIRAVPNDAAC